MGELHLEEEFFTGEDGKPWVTERWIFEDGSLYSENTHPVWEVTGE